MACFCSCSEEKIAEQSATEEATVDEIISSFESESLSLPNVTLNGSKQTRSNSTLYYNPGDVSPIWDSYQMYTQGGATIYVFQLETSEALTSMVESYYYGKEEQQTTNAIFKLFVRQKEGQTIYRIVTYIPDESYLQQSENPEEELAYDMASVNYSGSIIVSTLDGRIVYGSKYENGKVQYKFTPKDNKLYHTASNTFYETIQSSEFYLSFNLFTQKNAQDIANNEAICSLCGNHINECGCMVLIKTQSKATRGYPEEDDDEAVPIFECILPDEDTPL